MPTYTYTARDPAGNMFTGTMEAASKDVVRDDLVKMQYYPTLIAEKGESPLKSFRGKRVPLADLVVFSRQFAAMFHSGIPLLQVLHVLQDETESPRLREVLRDIHDQVEGGSSLRDAFARYPNIFSEFFLGMIEAGEVGGVLDQTLERVATHVEKQEELRQKVVSAFAYPIVVGVLCGLVVAFLVIFVIPVFASAYGKLGIQLPAPTRFLLAVSALTNKYWWALLLALVALRLVWEKSANLPGVKRMLDVIQVNLPLFGPLIRKVAVTRFVRTFAVMSECGVSILDSITVAEKVARNHLVSAAAEAIRTSVTAGESVAGPMRAHRVFPSMVVQMTATGEASGTMPEMMEKSADFLDQEIDRNIKRLITKLEPILTVVVAGIVGLILMAVYLPMFDFLKQQAG